MCLISGGGGKNLLWTSVILSRDTKTNVVCFSMTSCMFLQGAETQFLCKPWHGQYAASGGGQKNGAGGEEGHFCWWEMTAATGLNAPRAETLSRLSERHRTNLGMTLPPYRRRSNAKKKKRKKKTDISITVNILRNKSARSQTSWMQHDVLGVFYGGGAKHILAFLPPLSTSLPKSNRATRRKKK